MSILIITTKEGIIQFATGTEDLFGYGMEELMDKPYDSILSSPYREHNAMHVPLPPTDTTEITAEGQHKNQEQEPFPVRLSVSKMTPSDPNSQLQITVDEYKQPSLSVTLDGSGALKSCSKQIEDFFGMEADTVKGETLAVFFPPDLQAKGQKPILDPAENVLIVRSLIGRHKKGNTFYCTLQLKPTRMSAFTLYHGSITKLDPSVETIAILDHTETILSYSHCYFLSLFGYKKGELDGKSMSSIMKRHRAPGQQRSSTRKRKQKEGEGNNSPRTKRKSKEGAENGGAPPPKDTNGATEAPTAAAASPAPATPATTPATTPAAPTAPHTPPAAAATAAAPTPTTPRAPAEPTYTKDESGLVHILHKDGTEVPIHIEVFPYKTPDGKYKFSMKIKRVPLKRGGKQIGFYVLGEVLGAGTGGKVKKAVDVRTNTPVAIKIIATQKLKADEIDRTKREIAIMGKLDHENIIKLHDVIHTAKKLNIVMELIDGDGDLMKYIETHGKIPEPETHKLFKQILLAVNYCHNNGVIHRDIKHNNIMINKQGKIKLIDFGTSNFLTDDNKPLATFCGTPHYAAPEMMMGKSYDGALVDVWSLGVVLYIMLTAQFPFQAVSDLLEGTYAEPAEVSPECLQFLGRMLVKNPDERSHITELLEHPWLAKANGTTQATAEGAGGQKS